LAMKNSKLRAKARLFIDTAAPAHALLGLELDSISNLILTRGLLRFERRFGFGVHWGLLLSTILCSGEGSRPGQRWATRPRGWVVRAKEKEGVGEIRWAGVEGKGRLGWLRKNWVSARYRIGIRKIIFFFKSFYNLQTNLDSIQI
jgi:hypothetical protein